jgi:hypothetical protein
LPTSWFIVVFSAGQWWIDHEGKSYGPYPSRDEARDGAVRLARFVGGGRDWQVFAPDEQNHHAMVASKRLDNGEDEPSAT